MNDEHQNSESFWQRLFRKFSFAKEEDYAQLQDEAAAKPDLQIEFSSSRRIILAGLIVVGLFFGLGGLWVTFAEITGAIIASGEVRVDTERKTVQHLEGGIVSKILVRNGNQVEIGQPLLLIDGVQVVAVSDHTLIQMAGARMKEARLNGEIDLLPQPEWPNDSLDISTEDFAQILASEQKVFFSG